MTDPVSSTRAADTRRRLLFVVGPGRSGTSVTTSLLGRLGWYVPQPELLPDRSNPRGFGEPQWVVEFHRKLLAAAKIEYSDSRPEALAKALEVRGRTAFRDELAGWLETQFASRSSVVVKDPRQLWFVDLWSESAAAIGADVAALTSLRHPVPVSVSLGTNDYHKVDGATHVGSWINLSLVTEQVTRGLNRAWLEYDELIDDWRTTLGAAMRRLDVDVLGEASGDQLEHADALVDPALRRSALGWNEIDVPDALRSLAEQVYTELRMSATGTPEDTSDRLDRLRVEYAQMYDYAAALIRSRMNGIRRQAYRRGLRDGRAAGTTTATAGAPSTLPRLRRVAARLKRAASRRRRG